MARIANPTFKMSNGVVFELTAIQPLVMQRWNIEYNKRCPPPEPPSREVKIINTPTIQHDMQDPYYQQQFSVWAQEKNDAEVTYLLSRGVRNKQPADWQPDPETIPPNPTDNMLKALWVSEQITTLADLDGLKEAILSLSGLTDEAIKEAEKN